MSLLSLLLACQTDPVIDSADDQPRFEETEGVTTIDSAALRDSGTLEPHLTADTSSTTDTDTEIDTGPVLPGVDISGRTYVFSTVLMNQLLPTGVVFTFSNSIYMMEVLADDGVTLDVRFGVWDYFGASLSQDLCSETLDVFGADFSADPFLTVGPLTATTNLGGVLYPMETLVVQIRFNPAYDTITNAGMEMSLDTSPLSQAVYGNDSGYCSYLGGFGVGCSPCPSGAPYCIRWRTSDVKATWEPGQNVTPRTTADIQADPSCP